MSYLAVRRGATGGGLYLTWGCAQNGTTGLGLERLPLTQGTSEGGVTRKRNPAGFHLRPDVFVGLNYQAIT